MSRRDLNIGRRARDVLATGRDGGASAKRRRRDGRGSGRTRRSGIARGERIGAEGIGEPRSVEPERAGPCMVEGRAGKPVAQRMRAGPRHARSAGSAGDAAGFDKRGEEDALFGRGPVRAGEWMRLLGHPTG